LFELGIVGKHGRKNIGESWKDPNGFFLKETKGTIKNNNNECHKY